MTRLPIGRVTPAQGKSRRALILSDQPTAHKLESDLKQAINAGAKSVILYANPNVIGDNGLSTRLASLTREACIPMLGPSSIGYVNYSEQTIGSWIPPN